MCDDMTAAGSGLHHSSSTPDGLQRFRPRPGTAPAMFQEACPGGSACAARKQRRSRAALMAHMKQRATRAFRPGKRLGLRVDSGVRLVFVATAFACFLFQASVQPHQSLSSPSACLSRRSRDADGVRSGRVSPWDVVSSRNSARISRATPPTRSDFGPAATQDVAPLRHALLNAGAVQGREAGEREAWGPGGLASYRESASTADEARVVRPQTRILLLSGSRYLPVPQCV